METASIELWHGSSHVIKHPEYGLVKPNNDYGRGFYCTRSVELAKEWACAGLDDGFANRYTLTTDGLLFLDLSQPPYTILNWRPCWSKTVVSSRPPPSPRKASNI